MNCSGIYSEKEFFIMIIYTYQLYCSCFKTSLKSARYEFSFKQLAEPALFDMRKGFSDTAAYTHRLFGILSKIFF